MIVGNKKIYSVPEHYEVFDMIGRKGLKRRGSKGETLLLEPVFNTILVSRTYGKIMICRDPGIIPQGYWLLYDHTGDVILNARIFDILLGKDFLYILTDNPNSGELEWCLIYEDMQQGMFIGKFEIENRCKNNPFHIKKGIEDITIIMDEREYELNLPTGTLTESMKSLYEEEVIENYNIHFVEEEEKNDLGITSNCIVLLNPNTGEALKKSISIGDFKNCKVILAKMLGGEKEIPIERAEKLLSLIGKFENYSNGVIYAVLEHYIQSKYGNNISEDKYLELFNDEIETGWSNRDSQNTVYKAYTSESLVVVLSRRLDVNSRIHVTPYVIQEGEEALSDESINSIIKCYSNGGATTARINFISVEYNNEGDDYEDFVELPYSVIQRKKLARLMGEIYYMSMGEVNLKGELVGVDNINYGTIELNMIQLRDLVYERRTKEREKVKTRLQLTAIV